MSNPPWAVYLINMSIFCSMSWHEAMEQVSRYQSHLEQMSTETLIALHLSEDDTLRQYHRKIDACVGDHQKVPPHRLST